MDKWTKERLDLMRGARLLSTAALCGAFAEILIGAALHDVGGWPLVLGILLVGAVLILRGMLRTARDLEESIREDAEIEAAKRKHL